MHLLDLLQVIDAMDQADCRVVIDRARARLREIKAEDPNVYVVRRTYKDHSAYIVLYQDGHTPFMARDLQHSALEVYNSYEWAELVVYSKMKNGTPGTFEIVPVLKTIYETLPCKKYHDARRAKADRVRDEAEADLVAFEQRFRAPHVHGVLPAGS